MPNFLGIPFAVYANTCLLCEKLVIVSEKKKYYVCPTCNKRIVEEYIDKFVAQPWWNIITP